MELSAEELQELQERVQTEIEGLQPEIEQLQYEIEDLQDQPSCALKRTWPNCSRSPSSSGRKPSQKRKIKNSREEGRRHLPKKTPVPQVDCNGKQPSSS